jgi:hypothetical protein
VKRFVTHVDAPWIYDSKGNCLGKEVIEVDGFTEAELKATGTCCPECGLPNGNHGEYWVRTGGHPGGEVHGYYKKCSRMGKVEVARAKVDDSYDREEATHGNQR